MSKIKNLHNWNITPAKAIRLQKTLAHKIRFTPIKIRPKLIAGLDCAFSKDNKKIIAAAIVMTLPDLQIIETQHAVKELTFPYIPGLLSFREAPVCLEVIKKLKNSPDIFIIDGQGIAHPRRLGIASHLGLFLNKPTIGCAKSRLIGIFDEPPLEKGSFNLLKDKSQTIGDVLRTRTNVKPLFISVGNNCTLNDAIKIVLNCTTRYRLPEPSRLAHQLVSKLKTKV